MNYFHYHQNSLWVEGVPVTKIAQEVGTPCFIYSKQALLAQWQKFTRAFQSHPHKICYAVKANSNLAVLNTFATLNSGFDIVSKGELVRVIAAKGSPNNVVFSGVGKTEEEIAFALQQGIFCFNVESESELLLLNQIAKHHQLQANIALRINPDVDPLSHPYISTGLKENKFGIDKDEALRLYRKASHFPHLKIIGIACHIGSQITTLSPFIDACKRIILLAHQLKEEGIPLTHLDLGGGLGVAYQEEKVPSIEEYAKALLPLIPAWLTLLLEPGRVLVANAGILVTKVLFLKTSGNKHFCIVDSGMNDMLRPALYHAWHSIIPVKKDPLLAPVLYDVVGPICESSDFLGKERSLAITPGHYLAIEHAGAYSFVISSNYPSRPRAAEVMVKAQEYKIIRERETIEQLFAQEKIW